MRFTMCRPKAPLVEFGTAWPGWDFARGFEAPQSDLPGLHDISMTPRKYRFHATLTPPFRLAGAFAPATCDGLDLSTPGRFLALTRRGDLEQLQRAARACFRHLDGTRAPAEEADLACRRKADLSARQDALRSRRN